MARPRKKTEEETPRAEEAQVEETSTEAETEGTEELVSERTPEEAPAEEAPAEETPAEVAEEPVAEEEQPAAEAEELAPPAEAPEAEETTEPADEPPAASVAPAKAKRVRKPKEERRARTQARKARRASASDGKRKPITRLPKPEHVRGRRKERRGVVVSNAMEKTIVVRVDTAKPHRRYKKVVRLSRKIHAHDERNVANVGDVVRIVETRPLSKTKHWRLAEVVEQVR